MKKLNHESNPTGLVERILNLESSPTVSTNSVGGLVERIKNPGKIVLIVITISFGMFIALNQVSASTTNIIQPAELIRYNDSINVNGTITTSGAGYFPSVHIGGTSGEGGVTFFNGTIINASAGSTPVTFGDDVRIDGAIWRGPSKGTSDGRPLKIADTLMPALHNTNDIGTQDSQWRNIYYTSTLTGGAATLSGDLTVNGAASFANEITIADFVAVGGGGGQGVSGVTIGTDGDIVADGTVTAGGIVTGDVTATGTITSNNITSTGTLTGATANFSGAVTTGALTSSTGSFSGDITANGDINQDLTNFGAAKSILYVTSNGDCTGTGGGALGSQWTYNDSTVTCSSSSAGVYNITFSFDINNRYPMLTSVADRTFHHIAINGTDGYIIEMYNRDGTTLENDGFIFMIF